MLGREPGGLSAAAYDVAGRQGCTIHPDGTSTWYVYDAAGQQIQTINAMGEVSESVYDANGRVAQSRRYFNRLNTEDLAKLRSPQCPRSRRARLWSALRRFRQAG